MVNRVILCGNLGKDPEAKTFDNGNRVVNFSLATSENYKDRSGEWKQKTEWHNIQAWGPMAEKAMNLKKGDQIYLEGKLSTRSWEDQNGNTRRQTDVVASYFRRISKRERGEETMQEKEKRIGDDVSQFLDKVKQMKDEPNEPDELPF